MKKWKKYAALLLALVMCLGLVACGGAPDKLKSMVIDDSVEYDYSAYLGTWVSDKDTVLVFGEESQEDLDEAGVERSSRMYYTLSDANDEWIAAGLLQYSEEHGCVYAYNDYDGYAYKCQFEDANTLKISSFGTFTKVSGDEPAEPDDGENDLVPSVIEDLSANDTADYDFTAFLGTWLTEDESGVLAVEEYDDGRTHFQLTDSNDDWLASGILQYVWEYEYVYAYNEFDGFAYICWFDGNDTLNIESIGTFIKVSGDVPGETIGDDMAAVDPADAPDNIFDATTIGDPVEYDYSAYLGTWVGTDGYTLTVEDYSIEGAPFTLLDRYGDYYTNGIFRYVKEYGCVYAVDYVGNDASKCWINDSGKLEIPGFFSTYSKVTGGDSDYIVIYGTWYPDGDTSATKCIEFDSQGTMWSMYERGENGLWEGVDGGTLRETGVNQYEVVSDWYEGETFDCYFEGETLYWGSEDGSYEIYG